MKKIINKILNTLGYNIRKIDKNFKGNDFPIEISKDEKKIIEISEKYSMSGRLRMWSLIQSVKYIIDNKIEGDLVECGVWRGGNLILMQQLINRYKINKRIYGFDTFEGMSKPKEIDVDYEGRSAIEMLSNSKKKNDLPDIWAYCDIETVKKNILNSVNSNNITLVKGKVENTLLLKKNLPDKISILRLDTDWYESTKTELEILYPKLSKNGVLIIDDYGHFMGCKKAVDEYFKNYKPWFHYIDYTCRLLIKK